MIQKLLMKIYDGYFIESDPKKNSDFWEEIIISSTGQKLVEYRKF
jgi:hypothetical protein